MNKYIYLWIVSVLLPFIIITLNKLVDKIKFISDILPTGFLNIEVVILFILSVILGFFAVFHFEISLGGKIGIYVLTIFLVLVSSMAGLMAMFWGVR